MRNITIKYPDGTLHSISVYRVDRTRDGRVIISYYDNTNSGEDSFTEIRLYDGEWQKVPSHGEWSEYSEQFLPFNQQYSDQIIMSLPELIQLFGTQKQETQQEIQQPIALKQSDVLNPPKKPLEHITVVLFANAGGSRVEQTSTTYDSNTNTSQNQINDILNNSAVFKGPYVGETEAYRKYDISNQEKQEIFERLIQDYGFNFDISDIPPRRQMNSKYRVSFSSCDSWNLLVNDIIPADELFIDCSDTSNATYPDNLSSALHYELPLEIRIGNNIKTNGVERKNGQYR